jgi:hypothetical protein
LTGSEKVRRAASSQAHLLTDQAYDAATEKNGKARVIPDREAIDTILSSDYFEPEGEIDPQDPLQLKKGQMVAINPVDSGASHVDKGELISIGIREVVIKKKVPNGKGEIRVHFPRVNFSIRAIDESNL